MSSVTFNYGGAADTFWSVPAGVTSIDITAIGASGASGTGGSASVSGAGGYASCTVAVTPGQLLTLRVGGGGGTFSGNIREGGWPGGGNAGTGAAPYSGGGGAGYTGVFDGNGTVLCLAGGGGGGGRYITSGNGGAGGGATGNAGAAGSVAGGGGGGSQSAGGALGTTSGTSVGTAGGQWYGGQGSGPVAGQGTGGGGGSGFFGGGGGGVNVAATGSGGGGGGSSYTSGANQVSTVGGGAAAVSGSAVAGNHGSITITYSSPPNAPSDLSPALDTYTAATSVTVSAVVSDPDGANVYADFRWRVAGSGSAFNGPYSGSLVGSGGTSTITLTGLPGDAHIEWNAYTVKQSTGQYTGPTTSYLYTNRTPAPVASVSVSVTAGDQATVSWPASSDPDGQPVQYWVDYESSATTRLRVKDNIQGGVTSTVVDLSGYPASNNARFYVLTGQNPDIGAYSAWTVSADFKLNKPPSVPTVAGGAKTAQNPTLTATATDPNGDNWRAYFQIATDSGFTNIVDQGYGATVASGSGSARRGAVLNGTSTYYYRALAEDASGEQSGYSAGVSFTTPAQVSQTFGFTGGAQSFVVPAGVTSVAVDLYGASGGGDVANETGHPQGGQGGRTQGQITVTPGETLTIVVGQAGLRLLGSGAMPATFGGGGAGPTSNTGGSSGGGATDIRRGGTALANRVAVAAGGGGAAATTGNENSVGGAGGGLTGSNGMKGALPQGLGATQSAGGAGATTPGVQDGSLGLGGPARTTGTAGGGGGGYYGGGGGGSTTNEGGGGGGSALVPAGGTTTAGAGAIGANGSATLTYADVVEAANTAPNAPTLSAPVTPGGVINGNDDATFSWIHSDPDGDGQGGFALRRTNTATGVVEYWNDTGWQSGLVYVASASQTVILPSNAFPGGAWSWSVSTTDVYGAAGPFAANRALVVNGGYAYSS